VITFFADAIVVLFYIVTFAASAIVVTGCAILGYFELKGYFDDNRDANELMKRVEEYRNDFN
jgi:hypothetical protein